MKEEQIAYAAIMIGGHCPVIITGDSHANAIMNYQLMTKKTVNIENVVKGFFTTNGRFVSRSEAFKIAKEQKQFVGKYSQCDELYSDDVVFTRYQNDN
jgi:aspartate carbamoyltransferase regulatory subunit